MAQIQFKGKSIVWNHHLGVEYHELVPHKDKSLTDKVSLNDNLIIQGDNLRALKALLPTYAGKVKCIYIDPPYNTGNEGWAYSDNVSSPMIKDWLDKTVDREDLTRHDKWLAMMTPRLKLLRELLATDGAIFVSIDDNEQHHLRMLMDEVFDEENFVADFIWHHRKSSQNDIDLSLSHNYTFCFAKNREKFRLNPLSVDAAKFANPDNDPRGPWVADPFDAPNVRPNLTYEITNPITGEQHLPPSGRHWRFSQAKFASALADNRIVWGKNGKGRPQYKRYLSEAEKKGTNPFTIWSDISTATSATKELMALFDGKKIFDTPKPVDLIKRIILLASGQDLIILDSFAGSGTTAQAVLELNKEDGGNRKFILVEMEDYADKITAERVRRVIKGVPNSRNENLKHGLGGSFSYFTLGQAIDEAGLLSGKNLPSYEQMARYLFYTATGEEFDESKVDESKNYIGSSRDYEIYLLYKPDLNYLKSTALNLSLAENLPRTNKPKLIFTPAKYLDADHLAKFNIVFAQLPYEIYQKATK